MNIPKRLKALDFVKGLSLVAIFYTHLSILWGDSSWYSLRTLIQLVVRPLGPASFIFCAIFGSLISFEQREKDGDLKGLFSRTMKRVGIYLLIGAILNLFIVISMLLKDELQPALILPHIVFGWNVFTFIAVGEFCIYFIRKWSKLVQIGVIIGYLVIYYLILQIIITDFDATGLPYQVRELNPTEGTSLPFFIYYFFYHEVYMAPIMPWLAYVFLINLICGDLAKALAYGDEIVVKKTFRTTLWGVLTVMLVGILCGMQFSEGTITHYIYYELINDDVFKIWNESLNGYPLFLHRHNVFYIFFGLGYVALFTFWLMVEIDFKQRQFKFLDSISRFGKYTATVFLTHAFVALIGAQVNFLTFLLIYGVFSLSYILLINLWDRKFQGKFSVEWFIRLAMDSGPHHSGTDQTPIKSQTPS